MKLPLSHKAHKVRFCKYLSDSLSCLLGTLLLFNFKIPYNYLQSLTDMGFPVHEIMFQA